MSDPRRDPTVSYRRVFFWVMGSIIRELSTDRPGMETPMIMDQVIIDDRCYEVYARIFNYDKRELNIWLRRA